MCQRLCPRWTTISRGGPHHGAISLEPFRTIAYMDISLARQMASFVGALLILIAYVGHQMKLMDARGLTYNALNALGSAILAYIAFHPFQIGFVVLEVTWALISVYALLRPARQG